MSNNSSIQLTKRNIFKYILGGFFISLGVILMLKSDLGSSSWDALHYSLTKLLDISMGTATFIVAMIFTFIVVWLNRDKKYFWMTIPIVYVAITINVLENIVFVNVVPNTLWQQILLFIGGILILPLGGSLLIASTLPAGIFDELNLTLMRVFKSNNLPLVRVIMELLAVLLAFVIGRMEGLEFGKIHIGTLIFSITVGFTIKTYLIIFERIGIYENQQID